MKNILILVFALMSFLTTAQTVTIEKVGNYVRINGIVEGDKYHHIAHLNQNFYNVATGLLTLSSYNNAVLAKKLTLVTIAGATTEAQKLTWLSTNLTLTVSGGGGGGTSDATAANQVMQKDTAASGNNTLRNVQGLITTNNTLTQRQIDSVAATNALLRGQTTNPLSATTTLQQRQIDSIASLLAVERLKLGAFRDSVLQTNTQLRSLNTIETKSFDSLVVLLSIERMKQGILRDSIKRTNELLTQLVAANSTATIGTTTPTTASVTSSQGLSTTNALSIIIENIGSAVGQITEGGINYSIPIGEQYLYKREFDYTTNKYTPLPSLSVDGSGTNLKVTTYLKQ